MKLPRFKISKWWRIGLALLLPLIVYLGFSWGYYEYLWLFLVVIVVLILGHFSGQFCHLGSDGCVESFASAIFTVFQSE